MKAQERIILAIKKVGRGSEYTLSCNFCSRAFIIKGKKYNRGEGYYCSIQCANKGEVRNWKGGRKILRGGYIGVKTNDTRADSQGYYFEHRLVVEKMIGRKLSNDEVVHHKNENPSDNRIENLVVLTPREHSKHHHKKIGKLVGCSNCGVMVYKNKYLIAKFKNLYCSRSCYIEGRWKKI